MASPYANLTPKEREAIHSHPGFIAVAEFLADAILDGRVRKAAAMPHPPVSQPRPRRTVRRKTT